MVYLFQTIDNFRDLAECAQRRSLVCPSILFRSATLDYASEDDLNKLAEHLEVNTILDLRSELEAQLGKQGKPFSTFPVATALKMKPSDMTDPDPEPSEPKETTAGPARKTIMINFAGKKFRKYAVWKAAPIRIKLQIVGLIASGQKPRAVKLVGEEIIAKKGLAGLYRDFVDYCDQEICQALQILSDESNYPVLVHCTQGKDRTGLVTALALAAVGITEEKIIDDYAKSRQGLERVRQHMVKEMEKDGLDPSFADAPPEVMRRTFDYIKEKYNGVEGYLDYIGFGEEERKGLKVALSLKKMQIDVNSPKPKLREEPKSSSKPDKEGASKKDNLEAVKWSTENRPSPNVERESKLSAHRAESETSPNLEQNPSPAPPPPERKRSIPPRPARRPPSPPPKTAKWSPPSETAKSDASPVESKLSSHRDNGQATL